MFCNNHLSYSISMVDPIEVHVVPEPEYELELEAFKSNFAAGIKDGPPKNP